MEPNKKKVFLIIVQVFQIAYTIFGTLLLYVLIGYLLDQWMNTLPIFLIIGSLVGIIMSFKALMKIGR